MHPLTNWFLKVWGSVFIFKSRVDQWRRLSVNWKPNLGLQLCWNHQSWHWGLWIWQSLLPWFINTWIICPSPWSKYYCLIIVANDTKFPDLRWILIFWKWLIFYWTFFIATLEKVENWWMSMIYYFTADALLIEAVITEGFPNSHLLVFYLCWYHTISFEIN